MQRTQLTYDIVPDKSPLYTTVDRLNQSTCDLQVTAQNSSAAPVTVREILIELIKVDHGVDTVQLLLPGSASGIQFPNTITEPGNSTWTVTKPNDGQFQLSAGSDVTFQPQDTLSLTLQNVTIREGGDGTALVRVIEESTAGRRETPVGIGITQSTLDVQLSVPADQTMIAPGQAATLKWVTNEASSGVLTMPGNSPNLLQLDSANLTSGQQNVFPIGNTTYSLTCQGRGPSVTKQVNITIDEVTASLFGSGNAFAVTDSIALSWQTSEAVSCAISLAENPDGSVNVPFTNGQIVSCKVSATPDGKRLILTRTDDSKHELGRLTVPTPCPTFVTFVLIAEGAHTSARPTFVVNLLRPRISSFSQIISSTTETIKGSAAAGSIERDTNVVMYMTEVIWEVTNAGAVSVAVNGCQVSTEINGIWRSVHEYQDPPSATITCQGFGGPIGL